MQKACQHIALLTLIVMLSGCQYFSFPWVHTIEVQQGNIVTQDMVDQLKIGMNRRQVRYILGNPLIEDTFTPNRWDYYYSLRDPDKNRSQARISVFFSGDSLSRIEGNTELTPVESE